MIYAFTSINEFAANPMSELDPSDYKEFNHFEGMIISLVSRDDTILIVVKNHQLFIKDKNGIVISLENFILKSRNGNFEISKEVLRDIIMESEVGV